MNLPKINKLIWLVRKKNNLIEHLGFFRDSSGGFFIIGGPTGSYCSGHGEEWENKWKEIVKLGYLTTDIAIRNKILSEKWRPPRLSKKDKELIDILIHK